MHTVELLEHAQAIANQLGYRIRHEWLGGAGGGACQLKGKNWIFVDLGQTPLEQLEQIAEALRSDPGLARLELPVELRDYLGVRRTA